MILSDTDIKHRLERGDLRVEPLEDPDLQIQPASIDLRLGEQFTLYDLTKTALIDPRDPESLRSVTREHTTHIGDYFVLHPGEFALAHTLEFVSIPDDLVARVEGRSSLGRLGVAVHITAGFIDPGFVGQITLELANLNRTAVKLYPGTRICQLCIEQMLSPAERPYGSEGRSSKYQRQQGATSTRIWQEKDRTKTFVTREDEP